MEILPKSESDIPISLLLSSAMQEYEIKTISREWTSLMVVICPVALLQADELQSKLSFCCRLRQARTLQT